MYSLEGVATQKSRIFGILKIVGKNSGYELLEIYRELSSKKPTESPIKCTRKKSNAESPTPSPKISKHTRENISYPRRRKTHYSFSPKNGTLGEHLNVIIPIGY